MSANVKHSCLFTIVYDQASMFKKRVAKYCSERNENNQIKRYMCLFASIAKTNYATS